MWVCLCEQINDEALANSYAQGLKTVKQLKQAKRLGSTCGKCIRLTKQKLDQLDSSLIQINQLT
jgi:bacterioferritin-associated ferredoxin